MPHRSLFTQSLRCSFGLSLALMIPEVAFANNAAIEVEHAENSNTVDDMGSADTNSVEAGSDGSTGSTSSEPSLHSTSTVPGTAQESFQSKTTLRQPRQSHRTPIERRPVYFGVGLGAGVSGLATSSLGGTPLAGSFNLRLGGVIKNQYMLGVQGAFMAQYYGWEESKPTGSMLSGALGEFSMFPLAYLPWNMNLGVGWGSAAKVDRRADVQGTPIPVIRSGNGVAWMAGSGWDFFTKRKKKGTLGVQVRYEGTQSQNLGVSHGAMFVLWANIN